MVTQVGEKIAFGTVFGPHLDVGGLFSFLPIHLLALLPLSRLPAQPSSQMRFGGKVFCGLFIYTF